MKQVLNIFDLTGNTERKKIGLMFVAVILFVLFFVGGPDYASPRSIKNFWNLGHIFFFAIMTYLLLIDGRLFKTRSVYQKLFFCLFIAVLIGAGIELIQSGINRRLDIYDLWRDILGALIGFFCAPLAFTRRVKIISSVSLAALLIIQLTPWILDLADEIEAHRQFPLLSGFESELELTRWKGSAAMAISKSQVISGDYALKIDFGTEQYSGLGLRYFPADWSPFGSLIFALYNPDRELAITVRIHDEQHAASGNAYADRFNRLVTLKKGWNAVVIDLEAVAAAPDARRMDLSRIRDFSIFVTAQADSRTVYLDEVSLLE